MPKYISAFCFVIIYFVLPSLSAALDSDINKTLMRSTYKLIGSNGNVGTCFIMGKQVVINGNKVYRYVLITAAHVLDGMPGDNGIIVLRSKEGDSFIRQEKELKIRDHGKNLYLKHATDDVAVMYISIPQNADIEILSENSLATDKIIEDYDVHPGQEVLAIGFPYAFEGNSAGFPIIRSGRLSSYPLLPSKLVKTFIVDFNVFGGNSGGPVYLYDSDWHKRGSGGILPPVQLHMVMGLVSSQVLMNNSGKERLGLANVVTAVSIKETIDTLQ